DEEWIGAEISRAGPIRVHEIIVVRVEPAVVHQPDGVGVVPNDVVVRVGRNAATGGRRGIRFVVIGEARGAVHDGAVAHAHVAQGFRHHAGQAVVNQAIGHDDAMRRIVVSHRDTFVERKIPHDAVLDAGVGGAGDVAGGANVHGVHVAEVAVAIGAATHK